MDLDRLEEFVTIATARSFTKAAQQLQVHPATLSSRQKSFEKDLGLTLFTYQHGSLELTPAGQNFYQNGLKILQSYHSLQKETQAVAHNPLGHLTIAITGSAMPRFFEAFLIHIQKRYPHTHFDFVDDTKVSLVEGLKAHVVDLYLTLTPVDFEPQGLLGVTLLKTQPYIMLPLDHPLAGRKSVAVDELDHETFIYYPHIKDTRIRSFQEQLLSESGLTYDWYQHDTDLTFYTTLAAIHKGLIIYPAPFARVPAGCVALPLLKVPFQTYYTLFMAADIHQPEVRQFVAELQAFLRKEQPA